MYFDDNEYNSSIRKDVGIAGTHVYMSYGDAALQSEKYDGKYYVGERVSGDNPYSCWFTAKAWPLNEELDRYLLYSQEVSFTDSDLTKLKKSSNRLA